jgi:WD40 repeat protein
MNKQENTKEKSIPMLTPKAVFGIRTDIKQNIKFFSADKCAYIAGNYVVVCSVKEKTQAFFPANPLDGEITAFNIDESKDSILIVIAQKTNERASINLRFLKKNLTLEDQKNKRVLLDVQLDPTDSIISIDVNAQSGYIAALSGYKTPAVSIFYYDLRSATLKTIPFWKLSITAMYRFIQINPHNYLSICAYGDGGYALVNLQDYDKKRKEPLEIDSRSYNEFQSFQFNLVSCVWISNTRVAFLNSNCDLFIIDYNKSDKPVRKAYKWGLFFEKASRGAALFIKNNCLFITKDDGIMVKLDKKQTHSQIDYEKVQIGKITTNYQNLKINVHHISVNSANTAMVISTENNQVWLVDLQNDTFLNESNSYKSLLSTFPSDEINCIDVSRLKQLVAVSSKDGWVRIWNYINLQIETQYDFGEDEPLYLAFHPDGLNLIVIFKEKFKVMSILNKPLLTVREIPIYNTTDVINIYNPRLNSHTSVITSQYVIRVTFISITSILVM